MGEEKKYLYGAAVQGIQGFIFQTNELKDIVGASELVELICTDFFAEQLEESRVDFLEIDKNRIISAAGNIKYIFDDIKTCKEIVKKFPKYVLEHAPGVTISQAVVEYEKSDFKGTVEKLEQKLRSQRNKPMRSMTMGLMGIRRSRTTGLPLTHEVKGDFLDASTYAKQYNKDKKNRVTLKLSKKALFEDIDDSRIAHDIEDITQKNDWIAIIHADGNGLGQVVQKVGNDKDKYQAFSSNLDKATKAAAQAAYQIIAEKYVFDKLERIPIRPIVLGGDDFTVICRGDFALEYTKEYLKQFEHFTNIELGEMIKANEVFGNNIADKLTACAGVAFIKSSYPFYYGYNLAEALCDRAKKNAKEEKNKVDGQVQSCLMFHKVQDSFVTDFNAIAERELTPIKNVVSFEFGPYYLDKHPEDKWTLDQLMGCIEDLGDKEGSAIKSHLRRWATILHDKGLVAAQQIIDRLKSITPESKKDLIKKLLDYKEEDIKKEGEEGVEGDEKKRIYPVYDVLSAFSVIYQITKEQEEDKK
jgi:hypothetical protein